MRAAVIAALVMVLALVTSASAEPRHHSGGWGNHDRGHSWQRPRGHSWYRPWGRSYQGSNPGGAFWGGVVGGTIGSWLWRQQSERPGREAEDVEGDLTPWSREWLDWCARRYRTFDIESGTYRGYDGNRHFCGGDD